MKEVKPELDSSQKGPVQRDGPTLGPHMGPIQEPAFVHLQQSGQASMNLRSLHNK